MQTISWLALGLTLGLTAAPTPAPTPEKPEPTLTAAQLIDKLTSRDFKERASAAERLRGLGTAALEELRKAANHPDAEVRRVVADLLPGLEQGIILAPRKINLEFKDRTVRQMLDEVSKATGYAIDCFGGGNEQLAYSFKIENKTFWEAIDQICKTTGYVLQPSYGDVRLRLQFQDGYTPHTAYDGQFRFVATNLQYFRNVDLGLVGAKSGVTRRSESLTMSFNVFSEPKLPFLGMGEPRVTAAYDSEKNSLLPVDNTVVDGPFGARRVMGRYYGSGQRSLMLSGSVNLQRVSEKAQSIKLLRGTIPVTLLVEQKPEVVTDKIASSKGQKFTVGKTAFAIEEAGENANKQFQVKMSITEDNKDNPNDYTWMNSLYQRLELHDEAGNKFQVNGTNWHNSGPNYVQITFTYLPPPNVKAGPPAKLIFHTWKTLQHQIEFEFKDLPLP